MKKVLLPDALHLALKIEAAREGMSLQELLAVKLQQGFSGSPVATKPRGRQAPEVATRAVASGGYEAPA